MKKQNKMSRTTGFFVKNSLTDRMYKFIVRQRAVTSEEIKEEFKGEITNNHIPSYIKQILKNDLIVKSKVRAQSLKRKCSGYFVYGINEDAVNEKLYSLSKKVDEKDFLEGIKKAIFEILQKSDSGFTTSEILYELRAYKERQNYNNWDYVYTCLRELIDTRLIRRSSFKIPGNCMINGRKPGFVYGRDNNAITKKIISLMPPEVKDAFLMIIQSNDLYTIDIMEEKFKVTCEQIKSWFDIRFCILGWIKVYSYKTRRYYYNPNLNQKYVEEQAPKIHETQIVKSIFNTMNLGNEFEKQAIFYWVMYLTHRYGLQIRLNEDFPKHIPSWFNPEDIKKYTIGGEGNHKILVDVWKFDSEPVDYLVFCYDEILQCPIKGYAISIKRDYKSRMIGDAGKKYIAELIGCLSKGFSLDLKPIPVVNSLTPVIVMNNPNGIKLFDWARKCGCILLYSKKMENIVKYLNEMGLKYEDDMKLRDIKQYKELLEQYKDHKDVIIGKVKPEDLVKLKRENRGK